MTKIEKKKQKESRYKIYLPKINTNRTYKVI